MRRKGPKSLSSFCTKKGKEFSGPKEKINSLQEMWEVRRKEKKNLAFKLLEGRIQSGFSFFLRMYLKCVHHKHACAVGKPEGIGTPGTGVTGGWL